MTSASRVTSSIVLVMAPEPSVVASPETVAEWHTRAQLSTLLVPKASARHLLEHVDVLVRGAGAGEGRERAAAVALP